MQKGFAPIIIIVVIAAFVLGIGATAAYIQLKQKPTPLPQPSPNAPSAAQSPNPDSSPDPTADWETYNSRNYTVRYPAGWQVFKLKFPGYPFGLNPPSIKALNDDEIIIIDGDHYPAYNENGSERITINFRNDISAKDLAHSMTLGTDFPSSCTVAETIVSNTNAFKVNCNQEISLLIDSRKPEGVYQIAGYFTANSSITDQILSTFQFRN